MSRQSLERRFSNLSLRISFAGAICGIRDFFLPLRLEENFFEIDISPGQIFCNNHIVSNNTKSRAVGTLYGCQYNINMLALL